MCHYNVEIIAWLRDKYELVIPYLRGFVTLSEEIGSPILHQ